MINNNVLDKITIYNFLAVSSGLYTAGQPLEEELSQLTALGVHTVINLGLHNTEYALENEAAALHSLNMDYVHIPVLWEFPHREELVLFFSCMKKINKRTVLLHCAANKRVSIFLALYRRLILQESRATVDASIASIWVPNSNWLSFLEKMLGDKTLCIEAQERSHA